ncbi:MAG: RNA polymerase sigma factor [Oscillospiraceae bacterium]|nr:RNA polymerase sigma factor [Oscillospiraceae bacterium]
MDNQTLETLIRRICQEDNGAFEELYRLMKGGVFSFAYSLCGNWHTAEDVLQDTFLRIRQYAGTYQPGTNPKAWILTIAKNLALNTLRSGKRFADDNPGEDISAVYEQDQTEMIENRVLLDQLLKTLNQTERQIVALHAVSDVKHADIAKMLGKPYGTVLWTYSNAVKKLKKELNNS